MRVPTRTFVILTILIASFLLFTRRIHTPEWVYKPPYHGSATSPNRPGIGRLPAAEMNPLKTPALTSFWKDFVDVLVSAEPMSKEIKPDGQASREDEQVDIKNAKDHPRLDITHMEAEDLAAMQVSHRTMVEGIKTLSSRLPYTPGSRGVVMTAGGRYFGVAITSVRMLRRAGSELPVEVFLDSWDDYDIGTCEKILPAMNAHCFVMSEQWSQTPKFGTLLKYQYKSFALLFSSFEHILFLDADAFPAHNPDALLALEPYTSTGLVTWPDFWVSTVSHLFYDIASLPVPPLDARRSSESGIMLYNKHTHASSLLLATYYNYYGPHFYYPLFSQGAQGEGDKETFLHAALALSLPFYACTTPVGVLGRPLNGTWYTAGMHQGDPLEDYTLSHLKKQPQKDVAARPFFIHNNLVKMDVAHAFESVDSWRDENGTRLRIWGPVDGLEGLFGYDVEKTLWEELVAASCEVDADKCVEMRAHYDTFYKNPTSLIA
ncbi:nucleotide-diphospho-sugar transferase [Microthyrium microscopicum]|uniref:Nucleotide-diphospho-sugar transferase n=1 Tax=Microthyrium microscopicum TaxID=703497 RepID=A0A6A6U234_9PEZI|nr:nucleotide-diphospho-sugar transferase [Microthyrium microscopicum]